MKRKYKALIIIGAVVVLLTAAGFIGFSILKSNLEELKQVKLMHIDLSAVPDGVYKGSYSQFPGSAKVSATVNDHKITQITIIKQVSGRGQAAQAVTGRVVEAQSLNVDVVSGATTSSKVILLAIENALIKYAKD